MNCILEYDECATFPCLNGAQCVDHPGYYECICTQGWQGPNCGTGNYKIDIQPFYYIVGIMVPLMHIIFHPNVTILKKIKYQVSMTTQTYIFISVQYPTMIKQKFFKMWWPLIWLSLSIRYT